MSTIVKNFMSLNIFIKKHYFVLANPSGISTSSILVAFVYVLQYVFE